MINLLFAGNYKVFDGLKLCLMSMIKHTKSPLNIYILTADVTEIDSQYKPINADMADDLQNLVKSVNEKSNVKLIKLGKHFNEWVKSSHNKLSSYTPFAFLRLFSDELPELPNKILYLDVDIMINGDLQQLFDIDITDKELGVVHDRYGRFFINKNYFNSGMLLMNLKKIKETKLFDKVKAMCLERKMAFPDQTALNKCTKYKVYLPRKFNEQGKLRKDTVVQHFCKRIIWFPFHTINVKPWHIENVRKKYKIHEYDDIYEEFLKLKNKKNN